MDIGNINIDPGEAIKCGNDIISQGERYNKEVKTIYDIVDDLKHAWTGSSAQRYVDKIESFREDFEKLGKLISEVGGTLLSTGNQYKNLEENI